MRPISRRGFLTATAAATTAGISADVSTARSGGEYRVVDQVRFGGQTRRLKLTRGDRFITALIFPTDYPTHFRLKPELYPVCTPRGLPVTGSHSYCFIHHQIRNEFYVREYGLMTVSAMLSHDVRLTRQEPFCFAARFVAHDGPLVVKTADRLYGEFAERKISG
jgi:hypothetical protein